MGDKFTPGPWSVCDDGEPGEPMLKVVGRTARHEIALCCTGAVSQDDETANARLIAAAPDMLKALHLAHKRLCELNRDDEAGMRIVLANAINKATGEGLS